MKILAFELSSARGSIAFQKREQELFAAEFANNRKHSGAFFDNLQRCLGEFGDPDRIVVGLGPGSYAGTRIAIATAIGMQAATGADLLGLPSPTAFPTEEATYGVVGDARRQSFFSALIRDRVVVEGPDLYTREELSSWLESVACPVFSAEALSGFGGLTLMYPSASVLARVAAQQARQISGTMLEPIYLREPHITQPKARAS